MEVNVRAVGDNITVIELAGELNSATAPNVQDQILPLANMGSKILLDMSRVTYMSSAGLRTLLLLHRQISKTAGGNIVLSGLSEEIQDTMAITGFLEYFSLSKDLEAGLRQLKS